MVVFVFKIMYELCIKHIKQVCISLTLFSCDYSTKCFGYDNNQDLKK